MNESMSRYSIVERLTMKKLAIMDEKSKIDSSIEEKKMHVEDLKQSKADEKLSHEQQLKDIMENFDRRIRAYQCEVASLEKEKPSKAKMCDAKIIELDKALQTLQDISKAAVEEAKG